MLTEALQNGWLAQVFFTHCLGCIRISILGFYLRLFRQKSDNKWLIAVWVLVVLTVFLWASIFLIYCFMCIPLPDIWNWPIMELEGQETFRCVDGSQLVLSVGVMTFISDLWSVAVPCAYFQRNDLGTSRLQKIIVNIIFCSGFA